MDKSTAFSGGGAMGGNHPGSAGGSRDPADAKAPRERAITAAVLVLLALPWLWPVTAGPSANFWPLVSSWTCLLLALLLILMQARGPVAWTAIVPGAWLLAASVSALIGLAQWSGHAPAWLVISPARIGEAYGNLRQRNLFASLTSLGLLALLWFHGAHPRARWMVAAALLAVANAASGSRTGLLQWLAIAALMAAWHGPRQPRIALCGVALGVYGLSLLLLPRLMAAWTGFSAATAWDRAQIDPGCSSRKVLWQNVLELTAQRPWTGWGLGELDYAHYMHLYSGARFCEILDNAHNLPLHIAVEAGWPAAMVLGGAVLWGVVRARPWREKDPTRQLAWGALAMVAMHSLVEYPLWYGPFQLAVLLCLVLLWKGPGMEVRWRSPVAAAAVAGLGAMAWAGTEYDRVSDAYRAPEHRRPALRQNPVGAIQNPTFFGTHVRFAELALLQPNRANAARVHELASELLHHSPEPAVIEKLIECAVLLGRDEEALAHGARYRAAFPDQYLRWTSANALFVERVRPAGPRGQEAEGAGNGAGRLAGE